jgi:hypothetical protein
MQRRALLRLQQREDVRLRLLRARQHPVVQRAALAGDRAHDPAAIAHTPRPVVAKLAATLREVLHQPQVVARLEGLGYDVVGSTPDELTAFYQSEYKRFAGLVQVAGIKPE